MNKTFLLAEPRIASGKQAKKLRLEGWLPVHAYGPGFESVALQVKTTDFEKVWEKTGETGLVDVKVGDDTKIIRIRNIQWNHESRTPLHADFYQIGLGVVEPGYRGLSVAMIPVIFGALILILSFYLAQKISHTTQPPAMKKQVLALVAQKERQGFPVRLRIPKINVDATIEQVGLTSKGEMGVPHNTVNVGWFELGPRPGEKGSAVLAGHFDGENDTTGVFAHLGKLKEGDNVYIEDSKGISLTFVVRKSHTYDPGYAKDVFNQTGGAHLNLITCDGAWNEMQKSYSKRLVVFADMTH